MTESEYKELVTPEFVRELFQGQIVESNSSRFAITVCGKIISIGGKIFYDSHEQAVKGFYNSFNWRARRRLWAAAHPGDDDWRWWRSNDSRVMWSAFKNVLKEKYGFDIVQL